MSTELARRGLSPWAPAAPLESRVSQREAGVALPRKVGRSPSRHGGASRHAPRAPPTVFLSWPWRSGGAVDPSFGSLGEARAQEGRVDSPLPNAVGVPPGIRTSEEADVRGKADTERGGHGRSQAVFVPHSHLVVPKPRMHYNASTLAFLGDGVYEMYARRHFLSRQSVEMYYKRVMTVVCCETQDALLKRLLQSQFLTDEEKDVVRWGRNTNSGSRKAKGRAGKEVYSGATSLETLVGYLYLTNASRLDEVMVELGFDGSNRVLMDGEP